MKRIKKTYEGTAWKYENMFPSYVSIVKTGANWIPFSTIKFSDEDKQEFTEGYEVYKVVFPKTFTETQAKSYLDDKGFTDYSLEHSDDGSLFVVNSSTFEDVKPVVLGEVVIHIGKTNTAATQIKTVIEESTPIMKLEDNKEDENATLILNEPITADADADAPIKEDELETVALETDEPQENAEDVVADGTEEDEVTEGDEPTETQDTVNEVASFSDEEKESIISNYFKLKLSENSYIDNIESSKVYTVLDTLRYNFIYNLASILRKDDDTISEDVKKECSEFGDAVVAMFKALSGLDVSPVESASMSSPTNEHVDSTKDEVVIKLTDTITTLLAKITELENIIKPLDNQVTMQQYSKADVGAFDKNPNSEEVTTPKVLSQGEKNIFGL